MEAALELPAHRETAGSSSVSARSVLLVAVWFGLVSGYVDLGAIFIKRDVFHGSLYYEQGKHFRWVVPVANCAIMLIPGLVLAVVSRIRPGLVSFRSALWLLATLAIWGPLLRAPLYGVASLLVAAGCGRWLGSRVAKHPKGALRFFRWSLAVPLIAVIVTAVISLSREAAAESRAIAALPAPPPGARNVLLIVMDTVRAENLGLYGYTRNTSPHLARWAKKGVRFDWAIAAAPWTFPSHCTLMTGQWPSTLDAHWERTLAPAYPTLAQFFSAHGYATAGFAANTYWCSYESGMDRGFVHYEDYPLTLRTIIGSTMPGRSLLNQLSDYYGMKWIRSQSRDAAGTNAAFLNWLSRGPATKRPFFAFLNYLDAHDPFVPSPADAARFGRAPQSGRDYRMLLDYWDRDKLQLPSTDVELARDAYDNCIAALDRQVGALLDELERRGALSNTHVIITSDHGEQFGEHNVYNHGFSLYAHEVHVPLLVISPDAPPDRRYSEPVSLRDLAATLADLAGLRSSAPFPGRPLAAAWRGTAEEDKHAPTTALSEVDIPEVIIPQRGRGPKEREFTMSAVADGYHYIVDVRGTEELFELATDPDELRDLVGAPSSAPILGRFRTAILERLAGERRTSGIAVDYANRLKKSLQTLAPKPLAVK